MAAQCILGVMTSHRCSFSEQSNKPHAKCFCHQLQPNKMPHCVAYGCNFQSKGNKGSAVSIHSFPKEGKLRKKWEDACGRVQLPKYPYLCSRHFSAESFEDFHRHQLMKELAGIPGYKRQLKKDAVPTIFPHKLPKHPRVSSESRFIARERRELLDACLRNEPTAASTSTLATATNDQTPDTELSTAEETEAQHICKCAVFTTFGRCFNSD